MASPTPIAAGQAMPQAAVARASLARLLLTGLAAMLAIGLVAPLLVLLLPFPIAIALGGLGAFILGVVLAIRLRAGALVALGLVALFGFVGVASETQLWFALRHAPEVALPSIAEAPDHPEATRFTFPEAMARADLLGEARSTTPRSAGPPLELSAFAVPLVPPGWTAAEPIAAWLVCQQPRGRESCAATLPPRLTQAFRATPRPEAAQAALTRHRLTAVSAPAWLSATDDISTERVQAGWMALAWPVLAWLAWAVGVAVYRMVSLPRRRG
ncbi:hypothetical protein [Falsiroseomonas tokyonensis]|uniref:DUF4131 domain-containing protein n=1 Tax=Falsiroseomonas tokyonensis TaxID=430521 RepID=A0ABV7BWA9_9PROT|nr:hypothetical protein [Falsiroseomonas tokyonensis]MBU8539823.1 hypothetical protein [Falsiroseomonas tokyonensis]